MPARQTCHPLRPPKPPLCRTPSLSTLQPVRRFSLNAFQSGLVVSLSLAGALLGSVVALVYGDKLGRKNELLCAAGLYGEWLSVPCRGVQ